MIPPIAVTGASGQLGRLVLAQLRAVAPAVPIVAAVRSPDRVADLAGPGVILRRADYDDPASLDAALAGVGTLLMISSSEVGRRVVQHRNVIQAARRQRVSRIVYTSVLRADRSPLSLAEEHRQTEAMIQASGLDFTLLRHGWYTENYLGGIPAALAQGVLYGCAGDGLISSAPRADFAAAAVRVLTTPTESGRIYELAGDDAYTLAQFAAELSRQTGRVIPYCDLPESDYRDALLKAGLPDWLATGLASWDRSAAAGALFDQGRELSRLLGHPTTPLADAIRSALGKA